MALAAAIIFTVISAAATITQGFQQKGAFDAEANLLEDQGRLQAEESQAEAQRVANNRRKFRKRQKLAFLKNGVTLAGSPLLVLEETIRESQEEVNAIARRGTAQAKLRFQQAAIKRSTGRAAVIGGFGSAATTGVFTALALR